jgi:hypothetical protein
VTRDNLIWVVGLVGGVVVAVAAHLDLFPWLSPQAQHYIEMAGFIASILSGKFSMSPLPLSVDGQLAAKVGKL